MYDDCLLKLTGHSFVGGRVLGLEASRRRPLSICIMNAFLFQKIVYKIMWKRGRFKFPGNIALWRFVGIF